MTTSVEIFGDLKGLTRDQILLELQSAHEVGVDTETVSIEDKEIIGLSIAPNEDYAVWFAADSPYIGLAISILKNPSVTKVFFNSKFDFDVMEPYKIDEEHFEDAQILAYTLHLPLKLYNLAKSLGLPVPDRFDKWEFPKGSTMTDVFRMAPDFVLQKCCIDSRLTLACWHRLQKYIVESYYIDRDIVHILRHMEHLGVELNQASVEEFYSELSEQTEYLRALIQTKGCDPNSNMQVGTILARRGHKLPWTKTRKQLKVDEKILTNLDDPLAQIVLIYREKNKIKTTYAEPLLDLDRAYTHYNNTRVVTGRLSSSDPINMQNIPDLFRVVFMADTNFASLDANQLELRAIAFLAQDKVMMKAFADGEDIHRATMDRMGIKSHISNDTMARRLAKVLNFATSYLGEEETIIDSAKKEGIRLTMPEATDFRIRYFRTYPGLKDYIYSQREFIVRNGWVKTLYGRVRKADQERMQSPYSREAVIRELFNMPVQGTASEVIKKCMARAKKFDLRIQVHDELVYDGAIPNPSLFENVAPFDVPFKLKVGPSWGDLKEVKLK